MNESVLKQFSRSASPTTPNDNDSEGVDDLGSFGFLRGVRDRALLVQLVKRNGNVTAFGYAWLERIDFNPSEGITLRFAGQSVKIKGQNLNAEFRQNLRLLDGLCRHRIPWIREADTAAAWTAAKDAIVIESIEWP